MRRILPLALASCAFSPAMLRCCCSTVVVAQLAVMRAKDVAKEHDWGSRFEIRDCPADLAADTDIPVVLTMLSNAAGGSKHMLSNRLGA
jgi:hypothetical protein